MGRYVRSSKMKAGHRYTAYFEYGLDRTRLDGRQGPAIWCGHGVLARNLVRSQSWSAGLPRPSSRASPERTQIYHDDFFRSRKVSTSCLRPIGCNTCFRNKVAHCHRQHLLQIIWQQNIHDRPQVMPLACGALDSPKYSILRFAG